MNTQYYTVYLFCIMNTANTTDNNSVASNMYVSQSVNIEDNPSYNNILISKSSSHYLRA